MADLGVPFGGDVVDIAAILPGGVVGQTVFLGSSGEWGDTGLLRVGNPNGGQAIAGISFSVTELLDASGVNLTTSSQIEGLRIYSDGVDLSLVAADVATPAIPLELNVNTSTGDVEIKNPNSASSYTIGLNFYRLQSDSFSLNNDTWNSLDEQEGADNPGDGWEVGGGSLESGIAAGDFNVDGVVDAADYTTWRDGLGSSFTQDDFDIWVEHFGETGGTSATDADQLLELNLDGLTTIAPGGTLLLGKAFNVGDVNDIQFFYGISAGQLVEGAVNSVVNAAAVPEPASAVLGGLGLALAAMWRRRRRLAGTPPTAMLLALTILSLGFVSNASAQTIFTLDTTTTNDLTDVLDSSANPLDPLNLIATASSDGSVLNFNYTPFGPENTQGMFLNGANPDLVANWAIGTGTTPTDFSSQLGDVWQITWTANDNASTATDRFNIYIDDGSIGAGQEDYDLGFMMASGNGAAARRESSWAWVPSCSTRLPPKTDRRT